MSTAPSPTALTPIRVPAGTTALQALKDAGLPLKGPDGAVVVRDVATGDLKDLAWAPEADAEVEAVPAASADGRAVIRHSTAHVLAQAVQELFPGTRLGIGPPVENGFYYDFDPERPVHPRGPRGPREEDAPRSSVPGRTSPAARSATTTPQAELRTSRTSSS